MAHYYADSSVLVRRHAAEIGTAWVQALTDPVAGHSIMTSRISTIEVISAFQRKQREGGLTVAQATQLGTDF
jgi:predicted nucleic acid-binding protein